VGRDVTETFPETRKHRLAKPLTLTLDHASNKIHGAGVPTRYPDRTITEIKNVLSGHETIVDSGIGMERLHSFRSVPQLIVSCQGVNK